LLLFSSGDQYQPLAEGPGGKIKHLFKHHSTGSLMVECKPFLRFGDTWKQNQYWLHCQGRSSSCKRVLFCICLRMRHLDSEVHAICV